MIKPVRGDSVVGDFKAGDMVLDTYDVNVQGKVVGTNGELVLVDFEDGSKWTFDKDDIYYLIKGVVEP